jgi:hypothetical protein
MYNSIGQLVLETKNVKEKMQLDVKDFSGGIYLLQLESENGKVNMKVVIENR